MELDNNCRRPKELITYTCTDIMLVSIIKITKRNIDDYQEAEGPRIKGEDGGCERLLLLLPRVRVIEGDELEEEEEEEEEFEEDVEDPLPLPLVNFFFSSSQSLSSILL